MRNDNLIYLHVKAVELTRDGKLTPESRLIGRDMLEREKPNRSWLDRPIATWETNLFWFMAGGAAAASLLMLWH